MANLRIFKNNVTDEDRRYYWEVHKTRPTDAEILEDKRRLSAGVMMFTLFLGLFVFLSGRPQYQWDLTHKLAAEKLYYQCWDDSEKAIAAGKVSRGLAAGQRDSCISHAYATYQAENVPKYWGWGKIRWKIDN